MPTNEAAKETVPTRTGLVDTPRQCNTLIESIGVYLPPKAVSTRDILRTCQNSVLFPLERLTGIKFRRMAGEEEFAIDLARNAVRTCLRNSRFGPEDIDLIISCNISRYDAPGFHFSFEPSTSARLRGEFGMTNAVSFDISNACAGMFTGVNIAECYLKAGLVDTALVVSGEYITHLTDAAQKEIDGKEDLRMACLTLGDSGAAVILERTPRADQGFLKVDMYTLGKFSDLCMAKPTDRPHGGAIMLTQSIKIHAVAIANAAKHISHMVAQMGLRDSFNYVIQHQTARTAFSELRGELNEIFKREVVKREQMINNLTDRGNTSSTTHFVAMWDHILNDGLQDGDAVICAVLASGVTIGTCPYAFDDLPSRLRRMQASGKPREKTHDRVTLPLPPPPRIVIEAMATLPLDDERPHDSIELARRAGEACLARSRYQRRDMDILIHAGVYRNEFISEPALAALEAGALEINAQLYDPKQPKTFAFDILNGGVSFMNALHAGRALIASGKFQRVMIVSSEIDNNRQELPEDLLGIEDTAVAVILHAVEGTRDDAGFGEFVFRHHHEHIEALDTWIGQDNGHSFLSIARNDDLEQLCLRYIPEAVNALLKAEGRQLTDYQVLIAPQISPDFVRTVAQQLDFPAERAVCASRGTDLFTTGIVYGLEAAREQALAKPGDLALVIAAGSGVQVACTSYRF